MPPSDDNDRESGVRTDKIRFKRSKKATVRAKKAAARRKRGKRKTS